MIETPTQNELRRHPDTSVILLAPELFTLNPAVGRI
jgi:hypothetical protein